MKISIGIDISKKKCDYCIINGRGKVLERGQYLNTQKDARRCARSMLAKYGKMGSCTAACETTANMWITTVDAFERAGIAIKLANSYKMALINKTGKKTDKVDAEKIARILRMDSIPECYVPSAHTRGVRNMVRQHVRLAQARTRVINQVHNLLDAHGKAVHAANMYSHKALSYLDLLGLGDAQDDFVLRQCVRRIRHYTSEIAEIDRQLEAEAARNEDAKLLASMTGVGIYTAVLMAAEISEISRFETPKQMVSWAGFCPNVSQSGKKTYLGKIKKMDTDGLVNWAMCEAANVAVKHDARMKAAYEAARRRHADKHMLGIVVVAHKMVTIMWHMLKNRTPYESRNEDLYRRKLARLEKRRQDKA
ncbi:MAG: IS110 family transposase [Desulfovibrionales bacterium]|nr:IS110 family transposase [Desulfovibrionales bacterium]